MTLRAGDWVEVRTKDEILRSLDKNGRLQELPFMPQMFEYCGKRFKIYKRAHKTCDTVTGSRTGTYLGKRLADSVHLNLRCDGKAYDGCQAGCLIFWKEAWLKPINQERSRKISIRGVSDSNRQLVNETPCLEEDVWKATHVTKPGEEPTYLCQATRLP